MKITGKISITGFLKIAVDITLIFNVIILITLPFLLKTIYNAPDLQYGISEETINSIFGFNEIPNESFIFMLIFLYFSGICTALILVSLHKILKNLQDGKILDYSNALVLKHLSFLCACLVMAFLVKIILYNSFLTIFSFFVFIILTLFSLILSEVFFQGAFTKEENELTI